jgi:hypothetical protein
MPRFADQVRTLLALSGIGIAAASLLGLWISETSSLFGFMDYGFRATIVVAIVAEATAIVSLAAYLALRGALWSPSSDLSGRDVGQHVVAECGERDP